MDGLLRGASNLVESFVRGRSPRQQQYSYDDAFAIGLTGPPVVLGPAGERQPMQGWPAANQSTGHATVKGQGTRKSENNSENPKKGLKIHGGAPVDFQPIFWIFKFMFRQHLAKKISMHSSGG